MANGGISYSEFYLCSSREQHLVRRMLAAVAVLQVQEPRLEQEEEEQFANVKQQQPRELQQERVELAQEACGDSTLMILLELKCK